MNRREFLLFRTDKEDRIVELSCQRLYMNYLEVEAVARVSWLGIEDEPNWGGEPPLVRDAPSLDELFGDVERELAAADVLRVREADWLVSEELKRRVDGLIADFLARGGRVEG